MHPLAEHRRRLRFPPLWLGLAMLLPTLVVSATADDPESGRGPDSTDPTAEIDRRIRDAWDEGSLTPAERCSDRTFVRRVYLDLAGRVPTPQEVESFLSDSDPKRREVLIDLLTDSEDYVQHFSDLFDTLLMGRTDEGKYAQRRNHDWRNYLERIFRENRPWNAVVSEILLARPDDQHNRGAVWFLHERNNDHQKIAESIAPAIFGIRIECAQCHDHMIADEIEQEHYWGLVAFFNRSKNENTENGPRIAESAIGGFSEFANIEGDSSPNVLSFFGAETVHEERPAPDQKQADAEELYQPASLKGDPRVPKFSRRELFVERVVNGHPLVSRALVNRVWAMLMGRGIVHPFDEIDSVHPASHPELFESLANDFVASGHDLRRLIRAVAKSQAYQLQSRQPSGVDDPASFAWYLERPITAEQLARSIHLVVRGQVKNDAELVGLFRQQFREVLPDQSIVGVSDSLFLSNNQQFDQFLADSTASEHLVPRLMHLDDHQDRADAMFQAAYARAPEADERQAIVNHLNGRPTALPQAMTQVVWSLLTSAEFRFNH